MTIISYEHNFVFIKTRKTAGTSIEVDLSQRVEQGAVVTPILPPIEGHEPRNYRDNGNAAFYNHMTAREIRERIGKDRFAAMTRFCVEREPVEKCISHFHMLRNSPLHSQNGAYRKSWSEYVASGNFPLDHAKYSEIRENGRRESLATRFLRFDRLPEELPIFLEELGIRGFLLRTRAKSEYSSTRLVCPAQVTEEERDRIYAAFMPALRLTRIRWTE